MTVRQFSLVLALGIWATACDSLPFFGKKDAADSTIAAPADTTPAVAAVTVAPPRRPAPAPVRQAAAIQRFNEPWTPVDTGTVAPAMSRDQVIAVWGAPIAESTADAREYLYFRNGCEVTCGTFDVVFLENGVVVDVIARGPGHTYAGTSSSPMGRIGAPTPPETGTLLAIPIDSTSIDKR